MNKANKRDFYTTPEFWFSVRTSATEQRLALIAALQAPGAGAKAHIDTHVQSTMSLQLSGSKR